MSGLDNNIAHLSASFKKLTSRWEETKAVWNDSVRQDFEKEYWTALEAMPPAVLREMEKLSQVIGQARRDVK